MKLQKKKVTRKSTQQKYGINKIIKNLKKKSKKVKKKLAKVKLFLFSYLFFNFDSFYFLNLVKEKQYNIIYDYHNSHCHNHNIIYNNNSYLYNL